MTQPGAGRARARRLTNVVTLLELVALGLTLLLGSPVAAVAGIVLFAAWAGWLSRGR